MTNDVLKRHLNEIENFLNLRIYLFSLHGQYFHIEYHIDAVK